MPVRIYAHLSWTTFARLPPIDERVAEFLCRFLLEEARSLANRDGFAGHHALQWAPGYDLRSVGLKQLRASRSTCEGKKGGTGGHALQGACSGRAGASAHGSPARGNGEVGGKRAGPVGNRVLKDRLGHYTRP
jgi:hypothetical protein